MSAYSREILQATRLLCGSRGAMQLLQLHRKLLQRCDITEEEFIHIMEGCSRFLLVRGPAGDAGRRPEDCTVVAQTSLRLCRSYGREEPCGGEGVCEQLHLCRFFVYGTCRFGKGRKPCKFSHDVQSDHNYHLLRDCTLQELREDELFLLLLQNDPALLPEVCLHYNKGSGPHGCCTFMNTCTKVHLCQHFVQGDCLFGLKCKRQHAIDDHGRHLLEERGLSGEIIQDLPFIYRNIHHLAAAAATAATATLPSENRVPVPQTDETDICLHFIRNSCRFHNECRRVHFHLPYKWEVLDGNTWTDLQHMEDIERDFCDPSKTQSSGDRPVDFLTMTHQSRRVRRLSTVSSVTKPPHYMLTTGWLWYYKGDQGTWVEYGEPDDKNRTTSVTSRTLEEVYLSARTPEVKVVKGQREYVISFKDMYQRNLKHNTKRKVRRRPRFVSVAEVKKQAQ
ncbi:poly [ADP-ribose] polymerase 12-like isoform X1 [Seriola lalandi dorsalis]|uniref:Poly (ADP-ribose) polymerase family, member 12b n=1 Tax=Seriola lalandi dorsalis TaxID=1841481 RepID=A0A3B4YF63_SERLL|nr:poly [ADP-ribose] polymerase 12-like isoform X1 [Seriola lalandi dorsalis]